jgi:protein-disulfide isomerase
MSTSRRNAFHVLAAAAAGLAAIGLAACSPGGGASTGDGKGLSRHEEATDLPVGSKDAKVVMVEYASITCPHCAFFHTKVLPTIKERYVDTGKVRYVFREFPTRPVEIAQAGHLIARCAGDKRNEVIDALMTRQEELFAQAQGPSGVRQFFLNVAASAGMSEERFEACLKDEALLKTLVDIRQRAIDDLKVAGTPTIFINGKKFEAPTGREITPDDVAVALDAALAKAS